MVGSNFGGDQWLGKTVSVQVLDTSTPPTYKLVADSTSIDEGETIRVTLQTNNVPVGTKVNYVVTDHLELLDIDSPLGSFVLKSDGTDFVEFKPKADFELEGPHTLKIELAGSDAKTDTDRNEWENVALEITINDTSIPTPTPTPTNTPTPTDTPTPIPSYEISTSKETINEGEKVIVTLKTENVPTGSLVSYSLTNPEAITGATAIGNFEVKEGGITELEITANDDYAIDDAETILISITNSNFGGDQWKNKSTSFDIIDSSRPPTYTLSASSLDVDEGGSVVITLKTTNVTDGTQVTYSVTNFSDLGLEATDGKFIIENSVATVKFDPVSDYLLEDKETFTMKLMGSTMNPQGNWDGPINNNYN